MATSGPMADFAKLPTQKKILVFVVIGAMLGGLYFQFVLKSLNENLEAAEAESQGKAAQSKKLADDLPKYEELKADMKRLTAAIQENQKALPSEAEVPAFFETLERKVRESGVEISKWTKNPEESVEAFVRVPVAIELTGTFMQLKRFFASLVQKGVSQSLGDDVEERERVVSIENLSLTEPVVRNREIVLKAKFVAVTFRQEDAPEGDPARPVKATPRGTTPGPAAPSSAPMPTSTPAGAKASTESSIEKGATRSAGDGSAAPKGAN